MTVRAAFLLLLALLPPGIAADASGGISREFGGHVRLQGQLSDYEDTRYADGILEVRLIQDVYFGDRHSLQVHYEAVGSGGGLQERLTPPARITIEAEGGRNPLLPAPVTDKRRVFDMASTFHQDSNSSAYHRIDRLVWQWRPNWGALAIGRQAITWGNGRMLNPMDLFNPFSPVDFSRDYKIGDDMVHLIRATESAGELQVLYVPRRDPASGDISRDHSSFAAKTHLFRGITEIDLMAAIHYSQPVFGIGARGYVGDAAWWSDIVWQTAEEKGDYLAAAAGLDYAWTHWGTNFYGQIEAYYNGLGRSDAAAALRDPDVIDRLARGEMFTLGPWYADATVQAELHPLVNAWLTTLVNLTDRSFMLQPRLSWDLTQNSRLILGGSFFFGPSGSEYGGLEIDRSGSTVAPADTGFAWATWYF